MCPACLTQVLWLVPSCPAGCVTAAGSWPPDPRGAAASTVPWQCLLHHKANRELGFILFCWVLGRQILCFSKVALYYWILFHSSLQLWVEFAADGHHYCFTVIVIPSVPILLVFMLFAKHLFFQQWQTNLLYSLISSMSSSVLLTTTTSFKSHVLVAFHRILVSLVLFPSVTIKQAELVLYSSKVVQGGYRAIHIFEMVLHPTYFSRSDRSWKSFICWVPVWPLVDSAAWICTEDQPCLCRGLVTLREGAM